MIKKNSSTTVFAFLCVLATGRSEANTPYERLEDEIVAARILSDAGDFDSNRVIGNVINASGLSYNSDGKLVHDTANATIWMSKANERPTWVMVDFGAYYTLGKFKVWNYNQSQQSSRGLKNCDVYVSVKETPYMDEGPDFTDTLTWQCVTNNYEMPKATGSAYSGCDPVVLDVPVPARWFAMKVNDYHDSTYAGLSELQFFKANEVGIRLVGVMDLTLSSLHLTGAIMGKEVLSAQDVYFVWGENEGDGTPSSWENCLPFSVSEQSFERTVVFDAKPLTAGRIYKCALLMPDQGDYRQSDVMALHAYPVSVASSGDFYESDLETHEFVFSRPSGCSVDQPVSVRYALSGAAAADYIGQLKGEAVIPAGELSVGVSVQPVDNTDNTGARGLTLSIESGNYLTNGYPTSITVMVRDDEREAQTIKWCGGAVKNVWSDPDNWNPSHVPGITNNVYIEETDGDGVCVDMAHQVRSFNVGKGKGVKLFVENDLSVSQNSWFGYETDGASVEVVHTSGCVKALGGTIVMSGTHSSRTVYDMSGPQSSIVARDVKLVYQQSLAGGDEPTYAAMALHDGASVTTSRGLRLTPENAEETVYPIAVGKLLIDGGSVSVGEGVVYSGVGGLGYVDITNGTLAVNGDFIGSMPVDDAVLIPSEVNIWNGGVLNVGSAMTIAQGSGFNLAVRQWPGSSVEIGELKLGDAVNCTGVLSTNTVYEVNGGSLHVASAVTIGNRGQAELRLNGGSFTSGSGEVTLDCQRESALPEGMTYARPSTLRIAGDAMVYIGGALRPAAKSRGGRVAIETVGGQFSASIGSLATATGTRSDEFSFIPCLTATGIAPIHSRGGISLAFPMKVVPRKRPGAKSGTYNILEWEGNLSLSNGATISLAEGTDTSIWSLEVDTANKCVKLTYRPRGLTVVFR